MPYMRSSPASYSTAGVVPSPGRCPRHGYGIAIATVGAERYRAVLCGRRFGRRCGNRNLQCHGQRARASLCRSPKFIEVRPNPAFERTRRFSASTWQSLWRRAAQLDRWGASAFGHRGDRMPCANRAHCSALCVRSRSSPRVDRAFGQHRRWVPRTLALPGGASPAPWCRPYLSGVAPHAQVLPGMPYMRSSPRSYSTAGVVASHGQVPSLR